MPLRGNPSIRLASIIGCSLIAVFFVLSSFQVNAKPYQDNPTATALQATIFALQTRAAHPSQIDLTSTAQMATINALQGNVTPTPEVPVVSAGSALEAGQEAVVTADGNELYVMASPARRSTRLSVLITGKTVKLLAGPTEADGYRWWQVQLMENRTGWVVEGSGDQHYLAASGDPARVDVLTGLPVCKLFIGARIRAGQFTRTPIMVHTDPARSSPAIGTITRDSKGSVIVDGPINDRTGVVPTRWWKVWLSVNGQPDGQIGWVPEAEENLRFIDPIYLPDVVTNIIGGKVKVGDTVVATGSGDGMRLRANPDTTSAAETTLGTGVKATVLAGPAQFAIFTYWRIERMDTHETGWIGTQPGWLEVFVAP